MLMRRFSAQDLPRVAESLSAVANTLPVLLDELDRKIRRLRGMN
jgi:hypothetical protein